MVQVCDCGIERLFSARWIRLEFVVNKRIPYIWPGVLPGLTIYKLRFWAAITRLIRIRAISISHNGICN